jgi:hypothetical protein
MTDVDLEEGESAEVAGRNLEKLQQVDEANLSLPQRYELMQATHHWLEVKIKADVRAGDPCPYCGHHGIVFRKLSYPWKDKKFEAACEECGTDASVELDEEGNLAGWPGTTGNRLQW